MARLAWGFALAFTLGVPAPARGDDANELRDLDAEGDIDAGGEVIPAFDLEDLQAPSDEKPTWTPPPVSPRDSHASLDADKDGRVSREEFLEHRMHRDMFLEYAGRMFKRADGDKNGGVSLAKAREGIPIHIPSNTKVAELKFDAADTNGDGLLNLEELLPFMFPRFSHDVAMAVAKDAILKKDLNEDGTLTVEELFGIRVKGQDAMKARVRDDDQEVFKEVDIDGDGVVIAKELAHAYAGHLDNEASSEGQFDYTDTNEDGYITAEEAEAHGLTLPRAVHLWNGPTSTHVQRKIEL